MSTNSDKDLEDPAVKKNNDEESTTLLKNRATVVKPRLSLSNPRKVEEVRLAAMFGSLVYDYTALHFKDVRDAREGADVAGSSSEAAATTTSSLSASSQEKAQQLVLDLLNKEIPTDTDELRNSRLYQTTKTFVEFQRDQYLVGSEYATMASERRRKPESQEQQSATAEQAKMQTPPSSASRLASWATLRRISPPEKAAAPLPFPPLILPHDPTALGHIQIANVVAQQLLPLPALYDAALPWACKVPHWIYPPTQTALVNLIIGQECNLDRLLKRRLLTFLDNPSNRTAIKMSTQGFILSSSSTPTTPHDSDVTEAPMMATEPNTNDPTPP